MNELSEPTKKLIAQYKLAKQKNLPKEGVFTIHVDEIASTVASFYEKIRIVIDWKEEHLMRRAMIIRKLKRRFIEWQMNNFSAETQIAEHLVLELIRGGHFPNDSIPESKIKDVQKILDKYIFIIKNRPSTINKRKELQLHNWILEIAACEIEECLYVPIKETALINYMFEVMKERIVVEGENFTKEETNTQIYVAVQQALFKLDNPIITYNLLKYKYPQWNNVSVEFLNKIAENIYIIWDDVEKDLSHRWGSKFYTICEKYDTPYMLMGDILLEENDTNISEKISNPENLESMVRNAYKKRLGTLKNRLRRAGLYSTLSVLLGNAVSIAVLEYPLAVWIYGSFSTNPVLTILVDILGPTFLMFLFILTTTPPPKNNLVTVIMETMNIAYKTEKKEKYTIKAHKKRGVVMNTIISLIYIAGAVISFGLIIWIFTKAKFPITSIFLNVMFVALITFAGIAVRKKSQELTVIDRKGGLLGFIVDMFSLPVAATGRWLSNKWKKYNAIAVFFNTLIDVPFAIFVEFLEVWRFFLKDKKEEIR
jgi:hypothetical protein